MLRVSCINYIKIFKSCEVINSVLKKIMLVSFFYSPILFHRVWLLSESGHRKERCCKYGRSSSLIYQLSTPPPPCLPHPIATIFLLKDFWFIRLREFIILASQYMPSLQTPLAAQEFRSLRVAWSRTGQWLNLVGEYLEKCYRFSFYSTVLETGDKGVLISWTMARKYQLCHLIPKLLILNTTRQFFKRYYGATRGKFLISKVWRWT